ncbi:MAG: SGNH/GDSL hydrolase family protein [Pirellulales bacterium]
METRLKTIVGLALIALLLQRNLHAEEIHQATKDIPEIVTVKPIPFDKLVNSTQPIHADLRASFPDGVKQILFVGDSITYFGGYVVDIEAYLSTRYPDRKFEVLNFGVPSETVSGLNEASRAGNPRPELQKRIDSVLKNSEPQLVFICYGMNDGIYMPFDEARFAKFKEGIQWAHEQFDKKGAVIIHLTPPLFDSKLANSPDFDPAYNQTLGKYSDWLMDQKKEKGWHVIDLHTPMTNYLEEHRKTDANFALSKDGIHPNDLGHWLMAREILFSLGGLDIEKTESAKDMLPKDLQDSNLLELSRKRHDVLRNAHNTAFGFFRNGMKKGLAMDDAQKQADELTKEIDELKKGPTTAPAQ